MPHASVLIPAYNEEQNIVRLLERVAAERGARGWRLDDVIVVASGCTDATAERARGVLALNGALRVIEQERREGKASAINLGLAEAAHDSIVLISSDVLPAPGSITALLDRLDDATVGIAGGRPVPLNDARTFLGFATHLMWRLHHRVSIATPENPKCGEMIVFRRRLGAREIVPSIPADSAVDEVSVQSLVRAAGLRSVYVPGAIVHTWGPATVHDWLRQRRRINAGHLFSMRQGYRPSTMGATGVLRALATDRPAWRRPHWTAAIVAMEVVARIFAWIDVRRGRSHTVWKVASSTKQPIEVEETV